MFVTTRRPYLPRWASQAWRLLTAWLAESEAMARAEITQTMRIPTLGDFMAWEASTEMRQARDNGYIALLRRPEPVTKIYHVVGGELCAEHDPGNQVFGEMSPVEAQPHLQVATACLRCWIRSWPSQSGVLGRARAAGTHRPPPALWRTPAFAGSPSHPKSPRGVESGPMHSA